MREIFESTVEKLFGDIVTLDLVRLSEGGEWPADLWAAVEESGFALAAAPEHLSGAGSSWDDLFVVVRAAGRYTLPVPLPEALLANWLLGRAGLEPVSGPVAFAASSTLTIDAGKVSGQLVDVPWGRNLEQVVAIVDGAVPTLVCLAVADAATKNLRLNIAREPRDDLEFAGVRMLAHAPLPPDLPRDVLLLGGAMLRSAQIAGALQGALDLTSRYAMERVQFGRPIGSFQAIQHQIAVLAEHTVSATIAAEAAFAESFDGLAALPIMAAKVCTAEAASVGAGIAHSVHGAIGFTHEHPLHLATRRLWSWRSEFGSLTVWAQRLGRGICSGGASAFWPTLTSGKLPAKTTIGSEAR